jgi:xanthine dehydrogenase accessory factor
MKGIYEDLARSIRKHRKVAVTTVVDTGGSHPRDVGAKMIVLPDGSVEGSVGGGKIERMVTEDALQGMVAGEAFTKHYNLLPEDDGGIGMECGGDVLVFFEYPRAPETLLLCGAGHIASCLAPMAARAEFSVVVVDPRPDFALPERFPDALEVRRIDMDDARLRDLVDGNTYAVVITHGHENDLEAVLNLVEAKPKYIGMIGSKRKVATTFERLRENGVEDEVIGRIYAPIGLDIAAETPGEIAASILAELVAVRRDGKPSPISLCLGMKDKEKTGE